MAMSAVASSAHGSRSMVAPLDLATTVDQELICEADPLRDRGETSRGSLENGVATLQDQPIFLDSCDEGCPLSQIEDPPKLYRNEHSSARSDLG